MAYTNALINEIRADIGASQARSQSTATIQQLLSSLGRARTAGDASPAGFTGGGGPAGGGSLDAWISQALRSQGIPDTPAVHAAERLLALRESGGQNIVQQINDINSQLGRRARGPDQVIPPTFAAYRDPRLPNNVDDPVANIAASIRYRLSRYGSLVTPGMASAMRGGPYRGY